MNKYFSVFIIWTILLSSCGKKMNQIWSIEILIKKLST